MKLKLDAEGHVVLQDGKPVYTADDGKELAFDAVQMHGKITELGRENAKHRERADTAENKLKLFEGIEDPAAAKKAMDTVKNLDHKKLVDAGEVEKVKEEAIKAVEEKYKPIVERAQKLEGDLYKERVGGQFARSKFFTDKTILPPSKAEAAYSRFFKLEDGKMVPFDRTGNKIYSRARPGELADFEEAAEFLVGEDPDRDFIMKGTGNVGDKANHSNGTNKGAAKTMNREAFDKLAPADQMKAMMQDKVTVTD